MPTLPSRNSPQQCRSWPHFRPGRTPYIWPSSYITERQWKPIKRGISVLSPPPFLLEKKQPSISTNTLRLLVHFQLKANRQCSCVWFSAAGGYLLMPGINGKSHSSHHKSTSVDDLRGKVSLSNDFHYQKLFSQLYLQSKTHSLYTQKWILLHNEIWITDTEIIGKKWVISTSHFLDHKLFWDYKMKTKKNKASVCSNKLVWPMGHSAISFINYTQVQFWGTCTSEGFQRELSSCS